MVGQIATCPVPGGSRNVLYSKPWYFGSYFRPRSLFKSWWGCQVFIQVQVGEGRVALSLSRSGWEQVAPVVQVLVRPGPGGVPKSLSRSWLKQFGIVPVLVLEGLIGKLVLMEVLVEEGQPLVQVGKLVDWLRSGGNLTPERLPGCIRSPHPSRNQVVCSLTFRDLPTTSLHYTPPPALFVLVQNQNLVKEM